MKKASLTLSIVMILLLNTGIMAQRPDNGCEPLDLNSITYIEEGNVYDLGFNSKDYLPLDFDPYEHYVDLGAIGYLDEESEIWNYSDYLPDDFNPYDYPANFRTIDYIDPLDMIENDLDTAEYLPEEFDPFSRISETDIISL